MITYWLVALAVGLLIVDFNSYLKSRRFTPHRGPWTIPDSLVVLSTITAVFCVGLAWRYYVGSIEQGSDVLSSWLPFVLVLLAIGITTGLVEAWRGPIHPDEPIKDPYHLLDTSAPLAEPSLFQSQRTKKLALRGGTLALSILIGFSGAALLLNWGAGNVDSSFFASDRVRPTAQPTQTLSILESLEIAADDADRTDDAVAQSIASAAELDINELDISELDISELDISELDISEGGSTEIIADAGTAATEEVESPTQGSAIAQGLGSGSSIDENVTAGRSATSTPAIGGPLAETALEEITNAVTIPGDPYGVAMNPSSNYTVVIQALLGVKARSQPSTEGELVEVLTYGAKYRAVGRTSDGGWIQIQFEDNRVAWIITKAIDGLLFDEQQQIVALDELTSLNMTGQSDSVQLYQK